MRTRLRPLYPQHSLAYSRCCSWSVGYHFNSLFFVFHLTEKLCWRVACILTTLTVLVHFWPDNITQPLIIHCEWSKKLTATQFRRLFKIVVAVIFFPNVAFFVTIRNKIRSLETEEIIILATIGPGSLTAFLSFKFPCPCSLCSFTLVYQLSG